MRLITFALDTTKKPAAIAPAARRIGVQLLEDAAKLNGDFSVVDLSALEEFAGLTMRGFLDRGDEAFAAAKRAVDGGAPRIPGASVLLLAPIYDGEKIICIGMNYLDHCKEQNFPIPTVPILFSKFANSVAGPGDEIPLENTNELDYEVELVVVIGKEARYVKAVDARNYIAGFTVAHDVSARDLQMKIEGGQWLIGKTLEAFNPIGPAIVTYDEIENPEALGLRCILNGVTMQDSSTSQLIFNVGAIVEYITRFFALKPGDIILTGTPPGVGVFRKPPVFLKDGDVVVVEVDKIGSISNTVRAVPPRE